jgi:quercetin dioxygenase-like cupin family protein
MVVSGDEIRDPIRGQRLLFRKTAQDTCGELVEVEAFYQPGSVAPPVHLHPHQEEYFAVLAGSMSVRMHGQEKIYTRGEQFSIPAGTPHAMWNESKEEAHLLWQTRPALRTDEFFEVMWKLAEAGKVNKKGLPGILQLSVILRQYRREFRPVKPPIWVQHALFLPLAFLGKLCGYRPTWNAR